MLLGQPLDLLMLQMDIITGISTILIYHTPSQFYMHMVVKIIFPLTRKINFVICQLSDRALPKIKLAKHQVTPKYRKSHLKYHLYSMLDNPYVQTSRKVCLAAAVEMFAREKNHLTSRRVCHWNGIVFASIEKSYFLSSVCKIFRSNNKIPTLCALLWFYENSHNALAQFHLQREFIVVVSKSILHNWQIIFNTPTRYVSITIHLI